MGAFIPGPVNIAFCSVDETASAQGRAETLANENGELAKAGYGAFGEQDDN